MADVDMHHVLEVIGEFFNGPMSEGRVEQFFDRYFATTCVEQIDPDEKLRWAHADMFAVDQKLVSRGGGHCALANAPQRTGHRGVICVLCG